MIGIGEIAYASHGSKSYHHRIGIKNGAESLLISGKGGSLQKPVPIKTVKVDQRLAKFTLGKWSNNFTSRIVKTKLTRIPKDEGVNQCGYNIFSIRAVIPS